MSLPVKATTRGLAATVSSTEAYCAGLHDRSSNPCRESGRFIAGLSLVTASTRLRVPAGRRAHPLRATPPTVPPGMSKLGSVHSFSSQEASVASEPLTKGAAARVVRPFNILQLPCAPPAGHKAEHQRYPEVRKVLQEGGLQVWGYGPAPQRGGQTQTYENRPPPITVQR